MNTMACFVWHQCRLVTLCRQCCTVKLCIHRYQPPRHQRELQRFFSLLGFTSRTLVVYADCVFSVHCVAHGVRSFTCVHAHLCLTPLRRHRKSRYTLGTMRKAQWSGEAIESFLIRRTFVVGKSRKKRCTSAQGLVFG